MAAETSTSEITRCRICSSGDIEEVLGLGSQPLANALPPASSEEPVERFPLTLVRCRACGLGQLKETVPPEKLFAEYLYFSSYSGMLVENAASLVPRLIDDYRVGSDDLVVEIGSNDGYLLQFYRDRGIGVVGVEPATNVADFAQEERGIPTRNAFFGSELARMLRTELGPAKVLHANNVLAHVAELHDVMDGIHDLLAPDGVAVVEVAYVQPMLEHGAFDNIYHEHLCYYSLSALENLFRLHGLQLFDVERIETHGGSLRIHAGFSGRYPETEALRRLRRDEEAAGLAQDGVFREFARRAVALKADLLDLLDGLRRNGQSVVAFGAAAKATVLFNFLGIDSRTVRYVVDNNPNKQGRVIPGTDLVIHPARKVEEDRPDYLLLTAWNLAEEIMRQQADFAASGGRFITPLPVLTIS